MTNTDVAVEIFRLSQACEQMAGVSILLVNYSQGHGDILTDNSLVDYLLVNQIPYTVEPWEHNDTVWTHELTARVGGVKVHTLMDADWLADLREKEAKTCVAV